MFKTIFITVLIISAFLLILRDWDIQRISKKELEQKMKKEDEEIMKTISLGKTHFKRIHK